MTDAEGIILVWTVGPIVLLLVKTFGETKYSPPKMTNEELRVFVKKCLRLYK